MDADIKWQTLKQGRLIYWIYNKNKMAKRGSHFAILHFNG